MNQDKFLSCQPDATSVQQRTDSLSPCCDRVDNIPFKCIPLEAKISRAGPVILMLSKIGLWLSKFGQRAPISSPKCPTANTVQGLQPLSFHKAVSAVKTAKNRTSVLSPPTHMGRWASNESSCLRPSAGTRSALERFSKMIRHHGSPIDPQIVPLLSLWPLRKFNFPCVRCYDCLESIFMGGQSGVGGVRHGKQD